MSGDVPCRCDACRDCVAANRYEAAEAERDRYKEAIASALRLLDEPSYVPGDECPPRLMTALDILENALAEEKP